MIRGYSIGLLQTLLALLLMRSRSGFREVKKSKEYLAAGMFGQAIILLRQKIQTDPKNGEAHLLLGATYSGGGSDPRGRAGTECGPVLGNSLTREGTKRYYAVAKYAQD